MLPRLILLTFLFSLVTVSGGCRSEADPLRTSEKLHVPVNGRSVSTNMALEAYQVYRVEIGSPYGLVPLREGQAHLTFDGEKGVLHSTEEGLHGIPVRTFYLVMGKGGPLTAAVETTRQGSSSPFKQAHLELHVYRYHWWKGWRHTTLSPTMQWLLGVLAFMVVAYLAQRFNPERLPRLLRVLDYFGHGAVPGRQHGPRVIRRTT